MKLSLGTCPVEFAAASVRLALAESCGKCTPCRTGLDRILSLLERLLAGEGAPNDVALIREAAQTVFDSADCAIGFEAARGVLESLERNAADFSSHAAGAGCTVAPVPVPCRAGCPAHVDVPGYVALVGAGRCADAVRLIREKNPFPGVCGLVCEHPCETVCRRRIVDDAINIRAVKRYAVEQAGEVPAPKCAPACGKSAAIVGGGPAGLTAAYYLALAGWSVTVFEKREKLGGMLRYGIPAYRLPDADLDRDIGVILSTGVAVETGVAVGTDVSLADLRARFDAVYLSIGAHGAKGLGLEGEDAEGVLSAVALLREPAAFDFTGKRVVIVGGGNVAMDATRTAKRLGSASVTCVYRRRIADMTALPDEIAGAQAEGCEILQLAAPVRIATEAGRVTGLVVKPQVAGAIRKGRPTPVDARADETTVPADVVVVAIGQSVDAKGLDMTPSDTLLLGGDCATGPATVVRAIAAGREAAEKLSGRVFKETVEVPPPSALSRLKFGRVNLRERPAAERKADFDLMELPMTDEEAALECSRCLKCDRCGLGACRS